MTPIYRLVSRLMVRWSPAAEEFWRFLRLPARALSITFSRRPTLQLRLILQATSAPRTTFTSMSLVVLTSVKAHYFQEFPTQVVVPTFGFCVTLVSQCFVPGL